MKTTGLRGSTSRESTIRYYRIINETVKIRLGVARKTVDLGGRGLGAVPLFDSGTIHARLAAERARLQFELSRRQTIHILTDTP